MTTPKTPNVLLTWLWANAMLWVALILLAGLAVLACETDTVTGAYLLTVVLALAAGVATLGGIVLGSPKPNSQTAPHLIFVVAVIGLTVAMALEHVWVGSQVQYTIGAIIGGGLAGFGSTLTTSPPASTTSSAPVDAAAAATAFAARILESAPQAPPPPSPAPAPVPDAATGPVAPPAPGT